MCSFFVPTLLAAAAAAAPPPPPILMDTEAATLLLDLDADLLLFVIEASGARGQGVCKGVCKLLALLVEEVEKTTPFFASASIEGDEDFATTAMCANADISYPRPVAHALPLTCRVPF